MTPPVVVFDCVTFVQILANSAGPAAACWEYVTRKEVTLAASPATLAELGDVLRRPKVAKRLNITEEAAKGLLDEVNRCSHLILDVSNRFTYPRDPKDEPLVNLALASQAHYLVTWDRDLLDLMNDDDPHGQILRNLAPDLQILTPPAFLATRPKDSE